jgi:hypothetical protein
MGYTWKEILEGIIRMTEQDLERLLRRTITEEIRCFNPDPTDRVMAVLRESKVLAA